MGRCHEKWTGVEDMSGGGLTLKMSEMTKDNLEAGEVENDHARLHILWLAEEARGEMEQTN